MGQLKSLKDAFTGGEVDKYNEILRGAREHVMKGVRDDCLRLEGEEIVGLELDIHDVADGLLEFHACELWSLQLLLSLNRSRKRGISSSTSDHLFSDLSSLIPNLTSTSSTLDTIDGTAVRRMGSENGKWKNASQFLPPQAMHVSRQGLMERDGARKLGAEGSEGDSSQGKVDSAASAQAQAGKFF